MSSAKGSATRDAFGEILVQLGAKLPNLVVLDADLEGSTRSKEFSKKFPERHFQFGIAESNMVGTAAGLALEGKIPVATSFGAFVAGRHETIRASVAYNRANVKIVGTHAGLGIGEDGGSQMSLEDIALMRSLAGVAVLQPADRVETYRQVEWMLSHDGPCYMRLTRQDMPEVHAEDYRFQPGKIDLLHKTAGKSHFQAAVFASGGTVGEALKAAQALEPRGFAVKVYNVHTLKPLDNDGIAAALADCERAVSVEDHHNLGGLGSCIAEALAAGACAKPLIVLGVKDFGESGKSPELYQKYGISADHIAEACLQSMP